MKIVSWNINGFRAITGQNKQRRLDKITDNNKLLEYIQNENPDIICLQETKAHPEQINEDRRVIPGYTDYWYSCKIKKGYSGVVTYSKIKPEKVNTEFSEPKFDDEGRFIELDFGDFSIMNIYFPNGTSGMERVDYKLDFYDALFAYTGKLKAKGKKLIICGDYNTAHNEVDLARPKENVKNSGFMPIEREKIDWIVKNGYVDSFREFSKERGQYTWWSNRMGARDRNIGWRIDYHMVSENLMPSVKNSIHRPEVMGSDHCPIVIDVNIA